MRRDNFIKLGLVGGAIAMVPESVLAFQPLQHPVDARIEHQLTVAQDMSVKIEQRLNQHSIARHLLNVRYLNQGELARYQDKSVSGAHIYYKLRENTTNYIQGNDWLVPTQDAFTYSAIRLSAIRNNKNRIGPIRERLVEKTVRELYMQEEGRMTALLEAMTEGEGWSWYEANLSTFPGVLKEYRMTNGQPPYALLMNSTHFYMLKERPEFRWVTGKVIGNHFGYLGDVRLYLGNFLQSDANIWMLPEPKALGSMVVRQKTVVVPRDNPNMLRFEYLVYETIGLTTFANRAVKIRIIA